MAGVCSSNFPHYISIMSSEPLIIFIYSFIFICAKICIPYLTHTKHKLSTKINLQFYLTSLFRNMNRLSPCSSVSWGWKDFCGVDISCIEIQSSNNFPTIAVGHRHYSSVPVPYPCFCPPWLSF